MGALIGLDWGTSSLRAFLFGADGTLLEQRHKPWGVMRLPLLPGEPAGGSAAAFERAFEDSCGDWLDALPGAPVIACGMVGSAQGWREAPYAALPAGAQALSRQLTRVATARGTTVSIVPGMIRRGPLPEVMRGEETQVIGVLETCMLPPDGDVLIGLPGTHSKWVRVRQRCLQDFDTFMTGEVFALLCAHSILGRTQQTGASADDEAFRRGVNLALSADGQLGVLANIFSSRTLGLTGELAATAQADYLSGVLIGHELAALRRCRLQAGRAPTLVLVGTDDLCRRYAIALDAAGLAPPLLAQGVTERGLWRLACDAGLPGLSTPATANH